MQQRNVAENAAHAPHVLVFQVGTVAPAQHHHRQAVFTGAQRLAEVKFRRQAAVLRVADPAAVAPQVKGGIDAVEDNAALPGSEPLRVNIECERITSGGVICRHKRGIHRNRVGDVGINRRIVTQHLPVRGNRHVVRAVEILRNPAFRNGFRAVKVAEFPDAVQAAHARRLRVFPRPFRGAPAGKRRMGGELVQLGYGGVFPVAPGQYGGKSGSLGACFDHISDSLLVLRCAHNLRVI